MNKWLPSDKFKACVAVIVFATNAPSVVAKDMLQSMPPAPAQDELYVFYLHGQIVEDAGPRPTHPRWGLYDYPLILEALDTHDITVISEQRKPGTDHEAYARDIRRQVMKLLADGVPGANITVLGFSAGGMIAIRTSSISANENINFVIMASCSQWLDEEPQLSLSGRVYSVYEKSDGPQSCRSLADRKPGPEIFQELEINTGLEHGAFYQPDTAWVSPVLDWIRRQAM